MAWLSNVLVYTGGYLFLVFIAVCLATGLYYLAEIVEEYTRVTKKVLTWAIKISVGMNVALLVIDRLPFLCILISCGAQGAYTGPCSSDSRSWSSPPRSSSDPLACSS